MSGQPEILITRAFPDEVVAPYGARHRLAQGRPDRPMRRTELLRRLDSVVALVSTGADRIDAELLDAAPALRVVANFGVGYDSVDVAAATSRGIWVTNTPGVLTESTADIALLLLLVSLRRATEAFEHVRHGHWRRSDPAAFWGDDPAGLTLGILGMGAIGQALARRVQPLGMQVIYHNRHRLPPGMEGDPPARWVGFGELLETAHVISIHVPLSDATYHLISAAELAVMREGVVLVNTARGAIVDEPALIAALNSGHVSAVGLDVFEHEPVVPRLLRTHPRACCLPHIGSATTRTRHAMMRLGLDNAVAVIEGRRPLTPVNEPQPRTRSGCW